MKKLLALLLALIMLLSLAACKKDDAQDEDEKETKSSTKPVEDEDPTEPEETQEETTTAEEEEEIDRRADYESPYEEFETMDGVVIVDNDYVKVTLGAPRVGSTLINIENNRPVVYDVTVENKHSGPISCKSEDFAINGKTGFSAFYISVEKGETVTEEAYTYNVDKPEDLLRLTLNLSITDGETYDELSNQLVDIYPQGKAAYEEWQLDTRVEEVLLDEDGLYFAITGYELVNNEYQIQYIFANFTDTFYVLHLSMPTVNGFGVSASDYSTTLPNTYDISYAPIFMEELKIIGLEDITFIDLELELLSADYTAVKETSTTLYPEGKENAEEFEYDTDSDDIVVAETDEFTLLLVDMTAEDSDATLYFVFLNHAKEDFFVMDTDLKFNGQESVYSTLLLGNTNSVDTSGTVNIYPTLEDIAIEDLETFEMHLEVYDENFNDVFSEVVKIELN